MMDLHRGLINMEPVSIFPTQKMAMKNGGRIPQKKLPQRSRGNQRKSETRDSSDFFNVDNFSCWIPTFFI